jgi:transposase
MSFHGMTTNDLMKMFDVGRLTIYHWFNAWEKRRLAGLYDHKGRGRPPKLTPEEQEKVQQYIEQYPKNIKQVVHLLEQETSKRVSTKTITRLVKKTAMSGNGSRNLRRNVLIRSSMSVAKP